MRKSNENVINIVVACLWLGNHSEYKLFYTNILIKFNKVIFHALFMKVFGLELQTLHYKNGKLSRNVC